MTLKVYLDLVSQPCRSLYMVLKASNTPFQMESIELFKGQHLQEDYLKITPLHKIPAITENGMNLIESVAILRYLDATGRINEKWYPKEPMKRAKVDEYLEWHHINMRAVFFTLFQRKIIFPKFFNKVTSPESLAKFDEAAYNALDTFIEHWLGDKPFITGNNITAADLWASCEIDSLPAVKINPFSDGREKLADYIVRVKNGASPWYEESLEKLTKTFKAQKGEKSKM
ncbi:glutathione S-transferase theta-1-like [Onthophagus taurus]|uniref:glutathione S-transferase theta-1-like n=1 Tax=Onthophagus taurus TaxID=166361 RepID=UPI000C209429|nr:glutathione S-transferase theta-1-like [Onthophagus taurus]